jgi:sphingomyelin phosphodiesterase
MKIFSWNIACMPNYVNTFGNVEPRLNNIMKFIEIHNPDIISLQEVFSKNSRNILYKFFTQKKYNVLMSPYTRFLLNGGLFIASKYEIIASDYKIYKNYIGEDGLCQKGILYCQVKINNKYINIFNSHLNNDTPLIYSDKNNIPLVKKNQLNEFLLYFYKILEDNKYIICEKKDIIYIIAGDFNLDFQSEVYKNFISKLKNKLKVCTNQNEIITDIIEKKQVDYIINCYNKNLRKMPMENTYTYKYSILKKLSDHSPLIKKCIV